MKKYQIETMSLETKTARVACPRRCYDVNDLPKKIAYICSDSMEPAIRPEFLPFEYEGKILLAVKIYELEQGLKECCYKPQPLSEIQIFLNI